MKVKLPDPSTRRRDMIILAVMVAVLLVSVVRDLWLGWHTGEWDFLLRYLQGAVATAVMVHYWKKWLIFPQPPKPRHLELKESIHGGMHARAVDAIQELRREGWLAEGMLRGEYLWGVRLKAADLRSADLEGANLGKADLAETNLAGASLGAANLWGADLTGANLVRARLKEAYLKKVDLGGANLEDADLGGADLTGANLKDANLAGANLDGSKYDADTVWPEGFTPPPEAINIDDQD